MRIPKTLTLIDVGSGLKGFSQAFENDSNWEVISIDINKKFKPTICADLNHIPLKKHLKPDCLLMSPPCEKFSLMSNFWPKEGIGQALTNIGSCLELVPYLLPKKWLLENPKGRLRWFIGLPRNSIRYSDYDLTYQAQKPTDLWGNIDLPFVKFHNPKRTKRKGKHTLNFYEAYRSNRTLNAKIPLGISEAVKEAITNENN